jgi:GNAT superfamily N-acetyltransferase
VLGAAWGRLLDATDPGYGYLADDIPEVTIGAAPAHRGRGVGSALRAALIEQARIRGQRAISLSVEDSNRARALSSAPASPLWVETAAPRRCVST